MQGNSEPTIAQDAERLIEKWREDITSAISLCDHLGEEGKTHLHLFRHYQNGISTLYQEPSTQNYQSILAQVKMYLHLTHSTREELLKQATGKKLTQPMQLAQEKHMALQEVTSQPIQQIKTSPSTLEDLLKEVASWPNNSVDDVKFLSWLDKVIQQIGQLLEADPRVLLNRANIQLLTKSIADYLPKLNPTTTDLPTSAKKLALVRDLIKQLSGQLETLDASVLQGVGG